MAKKKKKGAKAKGEDKVLSPYGADGMPTTMMSSSLKDMEKVPVKAKKRGAKKAVAAGKKKAK
jgi:hypothetical protein